MIITIARQHGSNGHDIARALSEELGIPCYDKEIIDRAVIDSGYCKEVFDTYDEKRVSPYIASFSHYGSMNEGFRLNLQVVSAQFDAIRKIAEDGDAIFVGRCADYLLRSREDLVSVFIRGDVESRVKTLMERKNIEEDKARKLLKEVDKDRSSYYKYYTDRVWGASENYDLCIDSSKIGVIGTVKVIRAFAEARELISNEQ